MLQCGTNKQLKIELLSQWKLEAEFRNRFNPAMTFMVLSKETSVKTV